MNVQVAINDGISINIKPSKQYQLVKDRLQNNIAESSQKVFTLIIESVNKFLPDDQPCFLSQGNAQHIFHSVDIMKFKTLNKSRFYFSHIFSILGTKNNFL